MQTFTDLVGTSAVPAHAFDIAELTELTPALDTARLPMTRQIRRVRLGRTFFGCDLLAACHSGC